jgi:hypothetical protein
MQCVWSLITLVSLVFSFSAVYQWIRLTSLFISSPKDPTYFLLNVLKRSFGGRQKNVSSVTRYFARQLLNKHAKNYQNAEKITKFLLSTKVVWKSIKHVSKTKSVKRFPSLKLCFFPVFLSHLYSWLNLCKMQIWRRDDRARPRVPSTQSTYII